MRSWLEQYKPEDERKNWSGCQLALKIMRETGLKDVFTGGIAYELSDRFSAVMEESFPEDPDRFHKIMLKTKHI